MSDGGIGDDLRARALRAMREGGAHLRRTQHDDGSWRGDYGGPMFLLPMYVIVARFAEHGLDEATREGIARTLRRAQNEDGSVGVYAGGPGCVFTSSLAYVALRFVGVSPDAAAAARMAAWVRARGTPRVAAPWGKFVLALVDLYDWEGLDPLTPELWLLPYGVPFHPGRLWCHARQVYLPMAWLYGRRATRPADALVRALRDELYGPGYDRIDWRSARGRLCAEDGYRPPTPWYRAASRALGWYERIAPAGLRARALDETWRHITYEDDVTSYLRIGPVNAVLNTACHAARDPGGDGVRRSFEALEQYLWRTDDGVSMQGYNSSQLWDTAFALQALRATPCAEELVDVLGRAHDYLRDNQIVDDTPDAARYYRHRSRGAWPFSTRAHGWPITDCTAEALKCALAMEREARAPVPEALLREAIPQLLSWQNDDGGWATYERQRAGRWMEALNPSGVFGDIMVDGSFVECTSAVMQALAAARRRFSGVWDGDIARALARGERFLRREQRRDGSWEGSWGVCFTYGTWFGVSGLAAVGATPDDPALRAACRFLLARQGADGSWGEQPASCWERRYVAHPEGMAVMTAWALLALVRAGSGDQGALDRAAAFLVARQAADGSWPKESYAGVFNRTCMITYDNYRRYFPVWALGAWYASR